MSEIAERVILESLLDVTPNLHILLDEQFAHAGEHQIL